MNNEPVSDRRRRAVDAGGIRLAYVHRGSGDPPLIFVHGWCCDRSFFAPQVDYFARRHAVVAADLRGHGESVLAGPERVVDDIANFADDVLTVAKDAGFDRPVVIGHSLGGLVALSCAGRAGAVRAAVMIDPAPILNERVKAFFGRSVAAVEADADGSWRSEFAKRMFLPTDTVRRAEIIRTMARTEPWVAAPSLRAMERFDGAGALGAVEVPLLSIGSAVPSDDPGTLLSICPGLTLGQTVGSGHFNQLEVPDQVNLMIERFLAVTVCAPGRGTSSATL